jgi:hypothetical protein
MKLKLIAAAFALLAVPAIAFGQQSGSKAPLPSKADAQKVAQVISGDKAKLQAYCESKKIYDQMAAAYKKNDTKTADALNKQADALSAKIGPEYTKLMDSLEQVDQNSADGKAFTAIFAGIDKLCTGAGPAEAAQPPSAPPAPAQRAAPAPAPAPQPAPVQPSPNRPAAGPSPPGEAGAGKPCALIREACLQAGFVPNGANMGVGIIVDCIRPLMTGAPQRRRAAKPLPQVDLQLVDACKARNPSFGGGGGGGGGQPVDGPDQ